MAGTPHGRIDALTETLVPVQSAQEAFKTLFDFLSASARHTRIAWSVGTTGGQIAGATPGDDYWDEAEPFMVGAWAVFEFTNATPEPWYLLIQYMDGGNELQPDGGNIDGATFDASNAGIGIQMMCAVGSFGEPIEPWNGTTNNDGTDTKGSPWWNVPPGGFLYAFPRSNSINGAFEAEVNNLAWAMKVARFGTAQVWRFHIVADDDCFVMLSDDGDNGGYHGLTCGYYTARSDLVIDRALVMMGVTADGANTFPHDQAFGKVGSGADAYPGGIHAGILGSMDPVVSVALARMFTWQATDVCYPNKAFATPAFDTFPLFIGAYETAPTVYCGYLGVYDFVRDVYKVANGSTNVGKTRAAFGPTATTFVHLSIPWDGVTTPGTNATREGVSF